MAERDDDINTSGEDDNGPRPRSIAVLSRGYEYLIELGQQNWGYLGHLSISYLSRKLYKKESQGSVRQARCKNVYIVIYI